MTTPSISVTRTADGLDAGFTPGRFAVILALLICAAYPDVIFAKNTFHFRDFGLFGYPLAYYHRQSFWQGEIPLWNPLNNCGLPFLAQWNTLVLYPGSFLYLLFPISWSLGIYCLFHLFLAGLTMYGLAYRWVGSHLAASVAGLAFALNGLSLNCLMWPNNIAALAWMPLLVLCVERGWQQGGRALVAGGLAGGMQMLTGAPEIILFTWIILGGLALIQFLGSPTRLTLLFRFGLMVTLVASLAAAQLLPFLDLLRQSQRHQDFSKSNWSMPGTGWANLLVPLFYCYKGRHGVYFQPDQFWTSSYYLGVSIVALALSALWGIRTWRVRFLGTVAGLGLVLALGDNGYVYAWLRKLVPPTGYMRFPIKLVVLAAFAIPLLAGFAAARLRARANRETTCFRRTLLTVGVLLSGLIAGLLLFSYCVPPSWGGWKQTWQSGLSRAVFCWLILGVLAARHRIHQKRAQLIAGSSFLLLIGLDALTHAPRQNPTIPRAVYDPGIVQLTPQPRVGQSRAMMSQAALDEFSSTFTSNPMNDFLVTRLGLFSNANLLDDIPVVSGFYSLYLREEQDIWYSLYRRKESKDLSSLLDFLGVSQVTAPGKYFEFQRRTSYLPMATIGQRPVYADAETAAHIVAEADFDPREVVYLPPPTQGIVTVTNRTDARVISARYTAHCARIEVEAREPSLLVLAQACHPRWRAYVDDQRVPGFRANHAYQAVQVPAGRHTVKLVYYDSFFHAGVVISVLSLAGGAAVWRWQRKVARPAAAR